ncbi:MAG: hypothetical protein NXH75_18295, partial [Halobacteriovoraceae bacterium]|nr:hypothetical protein [Halobacteriovoraceae bacterium]
MRIECSQVKKQVNSLRAWTRRVEGRSCLEPKQRINYSGHCLLDISDCLPRKVLAVHKLTTAGDGPNCWNTSLVLQKALPHLRESSSFEFETFIRSPFCREILLPQLLKPGDIG